MTCYSRPAVRRLSGEAAAGTLENNRPAADPSPDGKRKVRCIVHPLPFRNPCPNEALDELGVCLKHIEQISAHWAEIVAAIIDQVGGDDAEKLRTVVDTLRRYSGGRA